MVQLTYEARVLEAIDTVVFSGGGLRGCCHIGILRYLEEKQIRSHLRCLIGTSIGAIISFLINISYTSSELSEIIRQFDYNRYQSPDLEHLYTHFGLDSGDRIAEFLSQLITRKGYSPSITFRELFDRTHIRLIVNAVCLNTTQNVYFDVQTFPSMPVLIAVRASMSLPFIFGSTSYQGLTYVDGGLLNNFPVNHPWVLERPHRAIGVVLDNTPNYSLREIRSLDQYCQQLFTCLYDAYTNVLYQLPTHTFGHPSMIHLIRINTPQYETLNLHFTLKDKVDLIELGYIHIRDYFRSVTIDKLVD